MWNTACTRQTSHAQETHQILILKHKRLFRFIGFLLKFIVADVSRLWGVEDFSKRHRCAWHVSILHTAVPWLSTNVSLTAGCWDEGLAADQTDFSWMFLIGRWAFQVTEIILTAALSRGGAIAVDGVGGGFLRALRTGEGAIATATQVIQTLTGLWAERRSWGMNVLLVATSCLHQLLHLQCNPVLLSAVMREFFRERWWPLIQRNIWNRVCRTLPARRWRVIKLVLIHDFLLQLFFLPSEFI